VNSIEVRDLVKRYCGSAVNSVDHVSFDVAEGHLFCLLGPNGAGKTTTLSILTTTLTATSGSVCIAGQALGRDPTVFRRQIGIVFQQPSLDLNLTAEENIRLHAVLYGLYPWRPTFRSMPLAYRNQVGEMAAVLGVSDLLRRSARSLSGGTRRKLEIIKALFHRPRVLFLDEPTAGLDPESRRSLWAYLHQRRHEDGTTVFLTTHYLEEAEGADTICILRRGRVIEMGSSAQVKQRHGRRELLLEATNGAVLRQQLHAIGIPADGSSPVRVCLDGRDASGIARALRCDLTLLQVSEPTLEDIYLALLAEVPK
jgi:ABC-2 type transport system ATP-binding protein